MPPEDAADFLGRLGAAVFTDRSTGSARFDDDNCAALDALLHSTTAALRYADAPLCTAVASAAASFLSGDKTADAAAALIQSRASVYMAEKYGK